MPNKNKLIASMSMLSSHCAFNPLSVNNVNPTETGATANEPASAEITPAFALSNRSELMEIVRLERLNNQRPRADEAEEEERAGLRHSLR
mmetsp:Transcript_6015/g.12749  ORF Transcript_6015/g.12749 Transcript_6015/m.12749 type:complete len:90 (-) Transcript_6015:391-660(-)